MIRLEDQLEDSNCVQIFAKLLNLLMQEICKLTTTIEKHYSTWCNNRNGTYSTAEMGRDLFEASSFVTSRSKSCEHTTSNISS